MVAVVALTSTGEGAGSVAVHERLGRTVGRLESVGLKHGEWIDTLLMQRPLAQATPRFPTLTNYASKAGTAGAHQARQVVVSARNVVWAARHAFHAHHFDARQPNRAQHVFQVRREEVRWLAASSENRPPHDTTASTARSRSSPCLPCGVPAKVRSGRTTRSIQVFSDAGTCEVVHRRGDQDDVRRFEFGNQRSDNASAGGSAASRFAATARLASVNAAPMGAAAWQPGRVRSRRAARAAPTVARDPPARRLVDLSPRGLTFR
jgi:hypothetical protein